MAMIVAAQGLLEKNSASHGIMWVAMIMAVVLAVIILVEVVDWIRERAANRRAELIAVEEGPGDIHLGPPDSELRQRYDTGAPRISREQRANEPARHAGEVARMPTEEEQ